MFHQVSRKSSVDKISISTVYILKFLPMHLILNFSKISRACLAKNSGDTVGANVSILLGGSRVEKRTAREKQRSEFKSSWWSSFREFSENLFVFLSMSPLKDSYRRFKNWCSMYAEEIRLTLFCTKISLNYFNQMKTALFFVHLGFKSQSVFLNYEVQIQ